MQKIIFAVLNLNSKKIVSAGFKKNFKKKFSKKISRLHCRNRIELF